MKKESDEKCENCRYCQEIKRTPGTGVCRFNPPVVIVTEKTGRLDVWPVIYTNDWCGKFVSEKARKIELEVDARDAREAERERKYLGI